MRTTLFTASALLSTAYASTVSLTTTPCEADASYPLQQFEVGIIDAANSSSWPIDINPVCGMAILSVSDGIDPHTVECQAFRDTEGNMPYSALFTIDNPASISTIPTGEHSVRCVVLPVVTLQTTPCLDPTVPLKQLNVAVGTEQPVPIDLPYVCGIEIVSVTDGIDVHRIQCQTFGPPGSNHPTSGPFTYDSPARLSTNTVAQISAQCVTLLPARDRRAMLGRSILN